MDIINVSEMVGVTQSAATTRLWRSVIARTIQEWISGPLRRQREAEHYLFDENADFRRVCEFAGMNIVVIRARLEPLRGHAIPEHILAAA